MDVPVAPTRSYRGYGLAVAALVAGGVLWFGLGLLGRAAPEVERASVWIDTVRRGDLTREVSGPGSLVPEEIRWITALTAGRVERILVEPGEQVGEDTVILELTNPEVRLQAVEADNGVVAAETALVELAATLDIEKLGQKSLLAGVRADAREARRRAEAATVLAENDVLSPLDLTQAVETAQELAERVKIEEEHERVLLRAITARVAAQEARVERAQVVAPMRARQLDALSVVAGSKGVLQELPLEVGQRVAPGGLLAKVVQPEKLRAELRIPQARAKEIALGQLARIDTHDGEVAGRVVRVDPSVQNGAVTVVVAFDGPLPQGARPDLSVDGRIELEQLADVLLVGRPAVGRSSARASLFKLVEDGSYVERVSVGLGASSVQEVQIVDGLEEGDRVILSDMSQWSGVDRLELD